MDKILDKVRKLLSLADSDNENEAKLAMERANELLLRYNLSIRDVNKQSAVTEGYADEEERFFALVEDKYLCGILEQFFFVRPLYSRRLDGFNSAGQKVYKQRLQFVGEPLNIEVAKFTYWYLVVSFRRLWLTYKQANNSSEKYRQAYYLGLMQGIREKLESQRTRVETETGLVWVGDSAIRDYLSGTKIKNKSGGTRIHGNDHAHGAGQEDGANLEIIKGLKKKDESDNHGKQLGAKS